MKNNESTDRLLKKQKGILIAAFALYALLVVWLVMFKLRLDPALLVSYRQLILIPFSRPGAINMRTVAEEIIYNIAAFVPLGIFLSAFEKPKKVWLRILVGLGVSLVFEILQYVFAIGTSDVTDLINNTLGTAIGVLIYIPVKKLLKEKAQLVTGIVLLSLEALALAAYLFLSAANI